MIEIVALGCLTSMLLMSVIIFVACAIYQSRRRIRDARKWYNDTRSKKLKFEKELLKTIKETNKEVKESLENDPNNTQPETGDLETLEGEYTFQDEDGKYCKSKLYKPFNECPRFRVHKLPYISYRAAVIDNSDQDTVNKYTLSDDWKNDVNDSNVSDEESTDNFFLTVPGKGCVETSRGNKGYWGLYLSKDCDADRGQQTGDLAIFVKRGDQYALKQHAVFGRGGDKYVKYNNWKLKKVN